MYDINQNSEFYSGSDEGKQQVARQLDLSPAASFHEDAQTQIMGTWSPTERSKSPERSAPINATATQVDAGTDTETIPASPKAVAAAVAVAHNPQDGAETGPKADDEDFKEEWGEWLIIVYQGDTNQK